MERLSMYKKFKEFEPITQFEKNSDDYQIEKRKQYIKYLFDNKLIRMKENSKSIYYDISVLDNKKYFELEDLERNEYINDLINVVIVNSKKGIGKTFQMRKRIKIGSDNEEKSLFLRRLEDDFKEQQRD